MSIVERLALVLVIIWCFIVGYLLTTVTYAPLHPVNWGKITNDNSVLIGDKTRDFCSGAIIGHGVDSVGKFSIVASAAHCFEQGKFGIKITRGTTIKSPAILIGIDKETDTAILKVSILDNSVCVVVAKSVSYRHGDEVRLMASPYIQFTRVLSKGTIVKLDSSFQRVKRLIMTDAQGAPGASGGAFLDTTGRLIGTLSTGIAGTSFSSFSPVYGLWVLIEKSNIGDSICYG